MDEDVETDNAKSEEEEPEVDNAFPPKKKDEEEDTTDGDGDSPDKEDSPEDDKQDKKDKVKKYNLDEIEEYAALVNEYNTLKAKYDAIVPEYNLLKTESETRLEADKNAMIASFYMLSDEDKAPILENKANYTVEQIEEKLSVIAVRNKVNFSLEDDSNDENKVEQPLTFNVDAVVDTTPAWLKAVENFKK